MIANIALTVAVLVGAATIWFGWALFMFGVLQ
jgi:hypothetical protein